jgi:predicted transcriptional regulator
MQKFKILVSKSGNIEAIISMPNFEVNSSNKQLTNTIKGILSQKESLYYGYTLSIDNSVDKYTNLKAELEKLGYETEVSQ